MVRVNQNRFYVGLYKQHQQILEEDIVIKYPSGNPFFNIMRIFSSVHLCLLMLETLQLFGNF